MGAKQTIQQMLSQAETGVVLDGPNPWDPQVRDPNLYARVLREGSLGLGEAYMEGWWDCEALDQFFARVLSGRLDEGIRRSPLVALQVGAYHIAARVMNRQSVARSKTVGRIHYDDRLFALSAYDARLTGSCAYWTDGVTNLDEAQEAKLELICCKLGLAEGDRVFDIGCGWGAFLGYSAENHGIRGVGVTISNDQVSVARERYGNLPVDFRFQDYREYEPGDDRVDHVVSMGMFEHVGSKNYPAYFDFARRILKEGGLFLLHTIVGNTRANAIDPWLDKYIFPNGEIPTLAQVADATEGRFVIEDVHNIGAHYHPTLVAWRENLKANRETIVSAQGEPAYRMYEYYLLCCAGGFLCRGLSVAQLVLSPRGVPGGYARTS